MHIYIIYHKNKYKYKALVNTRTIRCTNYSTLRVNLLYTIVIICKLDINTEAKM